VAFDATLHSVAADALASAAAAPQRTAPPGEAASAALARLVRSGAAAPAPQRYVIQAGRVFDGIRTNYQRHVDIHVEGQRIVAVVARDRLPLPETIIDATDLTVVPGFIDMHAHDLSLLGELAGRSWLAYGVTTVRTPEPLTASQRNLAQAWSSGLLPGPRLIEAPQRSAVDSTAQFALQLPALIDDPFVTPPGETPEIDLSPTLLPLLRPAGPASLPRRFSPAYAHYQDVYALLAAARATEISSLGIFAPGATAAVVRANADAEHVFEQLFSRADRRTWQDVQPLVDGLAARQQSLTRLLRAGGRVAIGTESPHTPPGLGEHIELQLFAAAGVANDQVLRSATSAAALALGLDTEIGTIEAGRRADLVIIEGDPLNDIAATLSIRAVVIDGQWIDRDALLRTAAPL
jgi:imidazolonepropionase-like amidohydrolase